MPGLPHPLPNMLVQMAGDIPHWFRLVVPSTPPLIVTMRSRFEGVDKFVATYLVMRLLQFRCVEQARRLHRSRNIGNTYPGQDLDSTSVSITKPGFYGAAPQYYFNLDLDYNFYGAYTRLFFWRAYWSDGNMRLHFQGESEFDHDDIAELSRRRGDWFLLYLQELLGTGLHVERRGPALHASLYTARSQDPQRPPAAITTPVLPTSIYVPRYVADARPVIPPGVHLGPLDTSVGSGQSSAVPDEALGEGGGQSSEPTRPTSPRVRRRRLFLRDLETSSPSSSPSRSRSRSVFARARSRSRRSRSR